MPEIFYIQDIFRKSKKIPTGNRNFWEKAIFIGYRWKNNRGTKSVDTIRFLHHSGASPFGGCATTFAPVGSVSLDSQSPAAPYESSSLATPQAGALWVLGIIVNW
ncbi:hypothetical protein [uncultured Dialister sp.]|uniref:hypothetical protein n=1 Tax=uncultured Dialister sp. TaxID=278064 RepID=UPI0026DABFD6|nr:hypothetical protein [uncultured Dialister sp.]